MRILLTLVYCFLNIYFHTLLYHLNYLYIVRLTKCLKVIKPTRKCLGVYLISITFFRGTSTPTFLCQFLRIDAQLSHCLTFLLYLYPVYASKNCGVYQFRARKFHKKLGFEIDQYRLNICFIASKPD